MTSEFGKTVRRLRARAGMTQDDLEQRSGLGIRTIRRVESDQHPNIRTKTVQLLSEGLGLEGDELAEFFAAAGRVAPRPPAESQTESSDDGGTDLPAELVEASGSLARELRLRWREEEEHRQLRDPFPLPVRWEPMEPEQFDSWANIRRYPPGAAAEPMDLTGHLDQIGDLYRRVPSGRLVVTGRAGAGKSILALRFALDRLSGGRGPTDPVPVIFRLESWNPETTKPRDWMAEQLLRDHPGLSAPAPGGATLAVALIEHDLILPILDGFDEVAAGLRRHVLEALNAATDMPLLMTSRPDQYRAAVVETQVLKAAAGVSLIDLDPSDLDHYLHRTTTRLTGGGAPLWEPVLAELRGETRSAAGANIAEALSTPLMASIARTVYSDTPDRCPSELLDTDRFGDAEAVEKHLLGSFFPTVYRPRPGSRRYETDQVRRWLGYLARHLKRLDTHDLAWWQFGDSMLRRTRMLITILTVGPAFWSVILAVRGILDDEVQVGLLLYAAVFGLATGTALTLVREFGPGPRHRSLEPSRIRVRILERGHRRWRTAIHRCRTGLTAGAALGFGYGILIGILDLVVQGVELRRVLLNGLFDATVFAAVFAFAAGIGFGFIGLNEEPLDIESDYSPENLLRANRNTVFVQVFLYATTTGVVLPLTIGLVSELVRRLPPAFSIFIDRGPEFGLSVGLISGIGGGVAYALSMTAWGQWLVLARLWLPLTGRLPWALPTFLEDAYDRGVLRRAGVVYQFRHERLRDHLADIDHRR